MKEKSEKTTSPEEKDTKAKTRSPNFPAFSLERSLELSKALLSKYQRTLVPWAIAVKTLGYSPKSSGGLQSTATLRYYGLLDIIGMGESKKVKLSDGAYNILIDSRTVSSERDRRIREAALMPPLFKKLVEQYPEGIPDSEVLGHELKTAYKVNPGSVNDFIKVFTETIAFAKVYESDIIGSEQEESEEEIGLTEQEKGDNKLIDKAKQVGIPILPKVGIVGAGSVGNVLSFVEFSPGLTFQLIAKENTHITQKTFERLIKFLELTKEDYPKETWAVSIMKDAPEEDNCEPLKEKPVQKPMIS